MPWESLQRCPLDAVPVILTIPYPSQVSCRSCFSILLLLFYYFVTLQNLYPPIFDSSHTCFLSMSSSLSVLTPHTQDAKPESLSSLLSVSPSHFQLPLYLVPCQACFQPHPCPEAARVALLEFKHDMLFQCL